MSERMDSWGPLLPDGQGGMQGSGFCGNYVASPTPSSIVSLPYAAMHLALSMRWTSCAPIGTGLDWPIRSLCSYHTLTGAIQSE